MHIETRGTGPDLVLLHGWAMHGGVFAAAGRAPGAALPPAPGRPARHGRSLYSPVPLELEAIADNLARRCRARCGWAGRSAGLVALQLAQRHPERARGLLMLCAPPRFVRGRTGRMGHGAGGVFQDFAQGLARDYRATIDRFLVLEAQGSDHGQSELALCARRYSRRASRRRRRSNSGWRCCATPTCAAGPGRGCRCPACGSRGAVIAW
jgi:pimeloyl-[acyl-carrier protein] methyl ester esterase